MDGPLQRPLEGLVGVTSLTRRGAESIVRTLVQQGEVAADRAERAVDELLARSERNRSALAELVRTETERVVARLGLARDEDLDALAERVARLEAALEEPAPAAAADDEPAADDADPSS
ncbi:MAG: phasin family protein [Actinomycetota bacterium]